MVEPRVTDKEYRQLYEFRARLLRFLRQSERRISEAGLTPAQYLLLLSVRGHPEGQDPTIRDVAGFMQLEHHSAVGLVNRAEAANLVHRKVDPKDRRAVRLSLTPKGRRRLERLASMNLRDLRGLSLIDKALRSASSPDTH